MEKLTWQLTGAGPQIFPAISVLIIRGSHKERMLAEDWARKLATVQRYMDRNRGPGSRYINTSDRLRDKPQLILENNSLACAHNCCKILPPHMTAGQISGRYRNPEESLWSHWHCSAFPAQHDFNNKQGRELRQATTPTRRTTEERALIFATPSETLTRGRKKLRGNWQTSPLVRVRIILRLGASAFHQPITPQHSSWSRRTWRMRNVYVQNVISTPDKNLYSPRCSSAINSTSSATPVLALPAVIYGTILYCLDTIRWRGRRNCCQAPGERWYLVLVVSFWNIALDKSTPGFTGRRGLFG
ncbi:hypothetical protein J6590_048312 [Homalodisca vitripennis]|nr:hypothetical protein J6590_048312 [Homalodisca vitripennis]